MRRLKITIPIVLIIMVVSCSTRFSTDDIPKENELKQKIIDAIATKSGEYDTIKYDYLIGICGNSSKAEINSIYNPLLNKTPFDSILSKKLKAVILIDDTTKYYRSFPVFRITGTIDNHKIHIHETLRTDSSTHSKTYIFEFINDKWILY